MNEKIDDVEVGRCPTCKWYVVLDCDPDDRRNSNHICTGCLHSNLINPDLSIGTCDEWMPNSDMYSKSIGSILSFKYGF